MSDDIQFDFRSIHFALTAAEHRSFSAAASVLNTRVSTVSRRVRNLEDQIGVSLFERAPSGVRLTNAGSRFVSEVAPALNMIDAALQNAGAAGRAEQGAVRIGIITTLAGGFLRELIGAFGQAFKGVFLDVRTGSRRGHLRAIGSRDLDIAFFTGSTTLPGCEVLELWHERVHVALATDHPLAAHAEIDWPALRSETFIVAAQEPGQEVHDYIVRRIGDYSTYPNISRCFVDQETLMHMVALGKGVTVVSEGWTSMIFPDLALRPLMAREDIVPFSAVWLPQNDNPALRRFISFARMIAARRQRCARFQ